jgi:hypothetical protein
MFLQINVGIKWVAVRYRMAKIATSSAVHYKNHFCLLFFQFFHVSTISFLFFSKIVSYLLLSFDQQGSAISLLSSLSLCLIFQHFKIAFWVPLILLFLRFSHSYFYVSNVFDLEVYQNSNLKPDILLIF